VSVGAYVKGAAASSSSFAFSRTFNTLVIGGIRTAQLGRRDLANLMVADCKAATEGKLSAPQIIVSSNGSVIARYHREKAFRGWMAQADVVDADGAPLVFASRWFCAQPLKERVATTDLIHDCCEEALQHNLRFYFLGGKPGVAEKAAKILQKRYTGLQIVGCRDGYFERNDEPALCEHIKNAGTNVLWLGLGSPFQERFAVENRERLVGLGWIRTCGGLFDHVAGNVPRAPAWMQRFGLEWLHRLKEEPLRLGPRYLRTNPPAAFHLLTKTYDQRG